MTTTANSGPPADWSDRRSDARANHERILAAAVELFAEKGVSATIPQIASRAGVGKATVYRSYPTKKDLVAAVAAFQLEWLGRYIDQAAENLDDPYETLRIMFRDIVDRLARDRSLAEALPGRAEDSEPLARIIAEGQRRGSVREGVTTQDIRVMLGGVSRVLFEADEHDPQTWRRYADLIHNAITLSPR
ncbi:MULTISPECIES: TetR/AcrR family transcriptional regulator [Nocardiaceae]|uniref:TetR/AcrR family transcriptional regulator n=1 Tax=Nocardiaceae TaxID=85025 RepID=UPI000AFEEB7E|nr:MULTISPECIES: TetR/AcrR family transcriptional regulator [Rhodococcus]